MKKLHYLLAFGAFATLLTSCDPETVDVEPAKEKTKTEMITGGKWQLIAATDTYVENGKETVVNAYSEMDACAKDDYMQLNTDGTATWDEGPTKCDSTDTQTNTGGWKFLDSETKIEWVDGLIRDTTTIDILTEVTLKVHYLYVVDDSNSYKSEQTFSRIN